MAMMRRMVDFPSNTDCPSKRLFITERRRAQTSRPVGPQASPLGDFAVRGLLMLAERMGRLTSHRPVNCRTTAAATLIRMVAKAICQVGYNTKHR
jgi:hypothetical protein